MNGESVAPGDLEYNVNYLFQWEGEQQYRCYAKDIPGKTEPTPLVKSILQLLEVLRV